MCKSTLFASRLGTACLERVRCPLTFRAGVSDKTEAWGQRGGKERRRESAERGSSHKIEERKKGGRGARMKYVRLGMEQPGSHVKMGTVDVPRVLVWLVKRFGGVLVGRGGLG